MEQSEKPITTTHEGGRTTVHMPGPVGSGPTVDAARAYNANLKAEQDRRVAEAEAKMAALRKTRPPKTVRRSLDDAAPA